MIKNFKWLVLVAATFIACNDNDEVAEVYNTSDGLMPTAGSANLAKYIALGDSYGAGYSDGALFKTGQEGSYAKVISNQFLLLGGGVFKTPYMADDIGGLLLGGNVIQGVRLYLNGFTPTPVSGKPTTEVSTKLAGPFNNLSIPGGKSFHLVAPGLGNLAGVSVGAANPYFARFATTASTTVLADAVVQDPTFFSLWIGGNDILSYATSGGTGKNQTGNLNPATYGENDITDPNVFANAYNSLVNGLTAKGAKGVVANLPYVNSLPFFTTVPYNPVPLDAATAALLNSGYASYNNGLLFAQSNGLLTAAEVARRTISFSASATNKVVLVDSYLTDLSGLGLPSYRQATAEDLIVLTARSFIGTTVGGNPTQINGVSVPLPDQWVLSKDEIQEVRIATDAYNVTIKTIADAKGLAFVELKATMVKLSTTGVVYDGFTTSSAYVFGGMFSLDGVHPSPRGYAIIANAFTDAINAKYGSNFKNVNVGNYRILYPANL